MARVIVFRGRDKEKTVQLNKRRMLVGRGDDADIRIDNPLVSRAHAIIGFDKGRWVVEDLESPNGLYVNGSRTKNAPLHVGDRIELGRHVLIFEGSGDSDFDVDTQRSFPLHDDVSSAEATAILKPFEVEDIQRRTRDRMDMHVVMVWEQQRKELKLDRDSYTIGYTDKCNLRLPGKAFLGKELARMLRDGDTYKIEGLSSMYKLRVNGTKVPQQRLKDGDRIQLRNVTIQFHQPVGTTGSSDVS